MKNHSDESVLEISNRCVTIWELDTREGYEQQIFENYFKYGKLVALGCLLNNETKIKLGRNNTEKNLVNLLEDGIIKYQLINKDLTTNYFSSNDYIRYIYEEVSSNAFFVNYFDNLKNIKINELILRIENMTYSYYQDDIRQTLGYYIITGIKHKDEALFRNIELDSTANSYVQIYQQNFLFDNKLNMNLINNDNKIPENL